MKPEKELRLLAVAYAGVVTLQKENSDFYDDEVNKLYSETLEYLDSKIKAVKKKLNKLK